MLKSDKRKLLSDRDVELIRELHEHPSKPMSLTQLAEKFEVGRRHIARICAYERRA